MNVRIYKFYEKAKGSELGTVKPDNKELFAYEVCWQIGGGH
jgi:hypothetical protein